MRATTILFRCAALLLLDAFATAAQSPSNAAPARVAILAAEPALGAADDMLTAAFSKRQGVILLERSQIEKVYREQQLSAGNQDLIKLGQILGADGLAILQTVAEGTNQFLQSRLIAVKPGVVLAEFRSPWPLKNLAQWSGLAASDFSPLLPKLTVLPKDAVPISILNLHSPLRTAVSQEFERELTVLLIHRLTHEPDLFVLERQHLNEAEAEKQLAPDNSPFWTGRYLLDGVVDKDGYNAATASISARLVLPQGGEPILLDVAGPRTNLNAVVELLVGKVLATLHRSPNSTAWNPGREADRFYEEAQWDNRWNLLPEAAAAGESAWALGRHDKALAGVLIDAYRGQTTSIESVMRAPEVFLQNYALGLSNGAAPDPAWYELGLSILASAGRTLQTYNAAVESRKGHEESLQLLRSLLRRTAAFLETNDLRPALPWYESSPNLAAVEWENAGFWVEKPEEALPVLRRILEKGNHPESLPGLAAWSWADRQRIPKLLRQFLDDLAHDTNWSVGLDGSYLAFLRAPDDGSGLRWKLQQGCLDLMWENRRWILQDKSNLWLFEHFDNALQAQLFPWEQVRVQEEPYVAMAQKLMLDYLADPVSAKENVFHYFFDLLGPALNSRSGLFPQPTAREFLQALEKFQPAWLPADRRNDLMVYFRRAAGVTEAQTAPPASPLPSRRILPAEIPIVAAFTPWDLRVGTDAGWKQNVEAVVWHDGKGLFRVHCTPPPRFGPAAYPIGSKDRMVFVLVGAKSGGNQEIPFPDDPDARLTHFYDFSTNSIYVACRDKVSRYRLDRHEWEDTPIPADQILRMTVLNGRVYVTTKVNLFELDPETRNLRIIASSRRQPPESEMDTLWDDLPSLFPRADNRLGAVTSDFRFFRFDPNTGAWARGPEKAMPKMGDRGMQWRFWYYSPSGPLLMISGLVSRLHRLLEFPDDGDFFTLLADRKWEKRARITNSPVDSVLTDLVPKWDWPDDFDLDTSVVVGDQTSLWVFSPRTDRDGQGNPTDNPEFSDEREATLFHFVPDRRDPFSVPIRLQENILGVNPLAGRSGNISPPAAMIGMPTRTVFSFEAPDSLVFVVPRVLGQWRIPKTSLEARFAVQRTTPPNPAPGHGSSNSAPAATNLIRP